MNLRVFVLWFFSISTTVVVLLGAPKALAATGGYPYPDKPCVHAPYSVQGLCPNYDWGTPGDLSSSSVISPYGYYYRNCTDYTAWKVSTLGVTPDRYKGLGDAKTWVARAPTKGVRVDGVPAAGSVAVRTSGTFGHTAYVEEVRPDGTIRISQYNNGSDGTYSEAVGTPAQFGLVAFLHFEAYQTVVPVAPAAVPPPAPVEPAPQPQPAPVVLATEAAGLTEAAEAQSQPEVQVVTEPVSSPTEEPQEAVGAFTPQPQPATSVAPAVKPPKPTLPAPKPEGRGATPAAPPGPRKGLPLPLTAPVSAAPLAENADQHTAPAGLFTLLDAVAMMGLASSLVLGDLLLKRSFSI